MSAILAWLRRRVRKLKPRTLFARATLAIVVPTVLLQVILAYVFYEQHWDNVTGRLTRALVGDIRYIATFRQEYPGEEHWAWMAQRAREDMRLRVSFKQGEIAGPQKPVGAFDITDRMLAAALEAELKRPYRFDTRMEAKRVLIQVQMADGVLEVVAPLGRVYSTSSWGFVLAMVGAALVLFGAATWFVRRELAPLRRLAKVADELGKGRDVPDFQPEGGAEVRRAATAFLTMRERLRRQVQQRTEMLAGVSHDLRTPLTRMKLSLAMLDSAEAKDLATDVVEMERMVEGYLAFARGEGDEDPAPLDLAQVLDEVADGARRDGGDVVVGYAGDMNVRLRPVAMRRLLSNLVGNALRYGKRIELHAERKKKAVEIFVDDDGPGIPPEKREDVFRPFLRLERSRNPRTGGVGLGMTIARDVARSHGGDVFLETSPLGGLRARVRLPV